MERGFLEEFELGWGELSGEERGFLVGEEFLGFLEFLICVPGELGRDHGVVLNTIMEGWEWFNKKGEG